MDMKTVEVGSYWKEKGEFVAGYREVGGSVSPKPGLSPSTERCVYQKKGAGKSIFSASQDPRLRAVSIYENRV